MFYTPSTITISEGETLRGNLSCAPNVKNNRDLDISIYYKSGDDDQLVHYKMCVLPHLVLPLPVSLYFISASIFLGESNADRLSGRNLFYSPYQSYFYFMPLDSFGQISNDILRPLLFTGISLYLYLPLLSTSVLTRLSTVILEMTCIAHRSSFMNRLLTLYPSYSRRTTIESFLQLRPSGSIDIVQYSNS